MKTFAIVILCSMLVAALGVIYEQHERHRWCDVDKQALKDKIQAIEAVRKQPVKMGPEGPFYLRDTDERRFKVGDSVAVIIYDCEHYSGNYFGVVIGEHWPSGRLLIRSPRFRTFPNQRGFDYQWVDVTNLENLPKEATVEKDH